MDLIKKWKKVKSAQTKQYQERWCKGASDEDLTKLKKKFGDKLPETFYEFLKVNDGSDHLNTDAQIEAVYENYTAFKGFDSILDTKKTMDDYEKADNWKTYGKSQWWDLAWIPFLDQYSGVFYVIDTVGVGENSTVGQIIEWNNSGKREVVFPSFEKWLEHYMAQLESKLYIDDPEGTGFWLGAKQPDGRYANAISNELKRKICPGFEDFSLPLTCRGCGIPHYEACDCSG